ncbi:hypothetical protein [Carboxydocella sp. ULO1]|nr:hypothetical protein [Carboxydocella sp. ULO1]
MDKKDDLFQEINLETTTVWSFPDRGNWATHKVIIGEILLHKLLEM